MYMTTSSFGFQLLAASTLASSANAFPLPEAVRDLFEPLSHVKLPKISSLLPRNFLLNDEPTRKTNLKKKGALKSLKQAEHKHKQIVTPTTQPKTKRPRRMAREAPLVESLPEPKYGHFIRPRDLTPLWARAEHTATSAYISDIPSPTPTAALSAGQQIRDLFEPSNKLFPVTIVSSIAVFIILCLMVIFGIKKMCHTKRFQDPRDYADSRISWVDDTTTEKASFRSSKLKVPDVRVSCAPVDDSDEQSLASDNVYAGPQRQQLRQPNYATPISPFYPRTQVSRPVRSHVRATSTYQIPISHNQNQRHIQGTLGLAAHPPPSAARRQGYERNFT